MAGTHKKGKHKHRKIVRDWRKDLRSKSTWIRPRKPKKPKE